MNEPSTVRLPPVQARVEASETLSRRVKERRAVLLDEFFPYVLAPVAEQRQHPAPSPPIKPSADQNEVRSGSDSKPSLGADQSPPPNAQRPHNQEQAVEVKPRSAPPDDTPSAKAPDEPSSEAGDVPAAEQPADIRVVATGTEQTVSQSENTAEAVSTERGDSLPQPAPTSEQPGKDVGRVESAPATSSSELPAVNSSTASASARAAIVETEQATDEPQADASSLLPKHTVTSDAAQVHRPAEENSQPHDPENAKAQVSPPSSSATTGLDRAVPAVTTQDRLPRDEEHHEQQGDNSPSRRVRVSSDAPPTVDARRTVATAEPPAGQMQSAQQPAMPVAANTGLPVQAQPASLSPPSAVTGTSTSPMVKLPEHLLVRVPKSAGQAPSVTPMDQVRLVNRISKALEIARQRDGEVRLRLSPPELGALRLEVRVRDGVLTARLAAETPEARQVLLDNLPALRERLQEQGLHVERFDVDLLDRRQQDSGGQQGQEQHHPRQPSPSVTAAGEPAAEQGGTRLREATSNGGRSINVVV